MARIWCVKTDVPIELKDCDVTVTKNAAFTFSAAQDSNITTAFANQATTGQATNVALQMYMPNGTDKITPNTETAQDGIQLATGDQTLKFWSTMLPRVKRLQERSTQS